MHSKGTTSISSKLQPEKHFGQFVKTETDSCVYPLCSEPPFAPAYIIVHKSMTPSMKRNDVDGLSPIAIGSQIKYSMTFRRFIGISTNRFRFLPHPQHSWCIRKCSKSKRTNHPLQQAPRNSATFYPSQLKEAYFGIVFNVASSTVLTDWLVHISFNYHASHPLSHCVVQVL